MSWKEGQSGNPNGRPKKLSQAAALARQYTEQAMNTLIKQMASEDENIAQKAALAILDRGHGKPTEYHEVETEERTKQVSDDVLFKRLMSFGIDPQLLVKAFTNDDP